ncbi:hypothetical protein E2C01_053152 [Portunus trituberculatus]|uniref:Uncharacterized protein n=1 Tax=Portunus trituberculatus TaxID=210409 RepID=A0A5B7GPK1_PORTR|nr:hypothetical protein [Portunus trituberculatus]
MVCCGLARACWDLRTACLARGNTRGGAWCSTPPLTARTLFILVESGRGQRSLLCRAIAVAQHAAHSLLTLVTGCRASPHPHASLCPGGGEPRP